MELEKTTSRTMKGVPNGELAMKKLLNHMKSVYHKLLICIKGSRIMGGVILII